VSATGAIAPPSKGKCGSLPASLEACVKGRRGARALATTTHHQRGGTHLNQNCRKSREWNRTVLLSHFSPGPSSYDVRVVYTPVLTLIFACSFALHSTETAAFGRSPSGCLFQTYQHFPLLIQPHIPSTSSLSRSTPSFRYARMATSVWSVMILVTLASAQTTTVVVSSTDASPSCGACLFGTTGPCIHDTTGQCFPFVSGGSHCDRGLR
jgi:hypothetical protein